MKIIFMGTPDFSAVVLEKLNSVYKVDAVVTGPDKPVGRGYQLKASPLKEKAVELGIPVLQYEKVSKEGIDDIRKLSPDIIVTAAFGQILSDEFLSIPKYYVLNVHASLLPKLRGSSPIQCSIINGDAKTGVTIMKTVKKVDAGDILLKKETEITDSDTAESLFDRLALIGGEAICEAVRLVEEGKAVFTPQKEDEATHCSMISKQDGLIDFSKSYKATDCFIRGMSPWPSAFTYLEGKTLKVFSVSKISDSIKAAPGTVTASSSKGGIIVQAGDGEISLNEIQLEGSKRMSAEAFLLGHEIKVGTVLK